MAEPLQEKAIAPDDSNPSIDATAESPPPEKANAIWTRRIIIFAFWAVVATLGLPHWIWTTSIYRSELPVEQMTQWAEGQVGVVADMPVYY
jgi:phosphatidylinositol glycan class S